MYNAKSISFPMFMIGRLVETIYMIRLALLLSLLVEHQSLFNCSSLSPLSSSPIELGNPNFDFDLISPTSIELSSIDDVISYSNG